MDKYDSMTLDDLLDDSAELLELRPNGWTVDHLHDVAKLFEEGGEVAECMVKSSKTLEDLGDELSDVLNVIGAIALRKNIDLQAACRRKQKQRVQKILDRFHEGKYPVPA